MTIRKWHWMSSAVCFVCMLLFAITGITLNHAADIESEPSVVRVNGVIPQDLMNVLSVESGEKLVELPLEIKQWLSKHEGISVSSVKIEASGSEIYIPLARPGGDAWLNIDITSGEFEYESTSRGWVSYFNDIHKGRNTGKAWVYFMDVFALACVIFSITGFVLLQRYSDTRSQTWPLVVAGLVVPVFFMLFLIHK